MRATGDRGANVVEFAVVAPLLFLLVFGIIDFGWAYSQNLDVKHAAREGARLAAVNFGTGADPDARLDDLIAEVRARSTELSDSETEVFVTLADATGDGTADDIGDSAVVCVRHELRSLTGALNPFLDGHLNTKAVIRMEKVPNFSTGDGAATPGWTGATCAP